MRTGELVNDTKHSPVLPNTEDSTIVDTAIVAHCRVNMLLKLTKDTIWQTSVEPLVYNYFPNSPLISVAADGAARIFPNSSAAA